jgi:hypothetical protein
VFLDDVADLIPVSEHEVVADFIHRFFSFIQIAGDREYRVKFTGASFLRPVLISVIRS